MSKYNINIHETIYSLSDALDLVGVNHIHHGKRVAYLATECAKLLGWGPGQMDELFQAAILHDCGVSKTAVHRRLAQFEWENEDDHCVLGSDLLKTCPLMARLAPIVLHHHTHWSLLKEMDLPLALKLNANCIYMADRVDVLSLACMVDQSNLLLGMQEIREKIHARRGDWFCPELVDAFLELSIWLSLEKDRVNGYVSVWLSRTSASDIEFQELRSIVRIFSFIVDAKSSFTKAHSDGVARLSRLIGSLFKLSEESCEMLELAGLLHDIGKLRQPDELLDKPGKLNAEEYLHIQKHCFDTYAILKNIHGLEKITQWATQHHERIDGSGYPEQLCKGEISLEARIVAVADVFQALAQTRPYRDAMSQNELMKILNEMSREGKLDQNIMDCVNRHAADCFAAAIAEPVSFGQMLRQA
jgi:HD-GYP domain-containing protein (c-di-GMP phosphodiesterase class II)